MCQYEHHLIPILCQKFFHLYLERVELSIDEQRYADTYGVADKFYECNLTLMKKLKKYFLNAEQFYNAESLKTDDEEIAQYYASCCRLFRSYGLWLEETRFNKIISLQQSEFPPQYDLHKLALIFNRNEVSKLITKKKRNINIHNKNIIEVTNNPTCKFYYRITGLNTPTYQQYETFKRMLRLVGRKHVLDMRPTLIVIYDHQYLKMK